MGEFTIDLRPKTTEPTASPINITPGTEMKVDPSTVYNTADRNGLDPAPKRRGPKKKEEKLEMVTAEKSEGNLTMLQSNEAYKDTYSETDAILKAAIAELGVAASEIGEDLVQIRASKSLRKKYDYVAALQGSRATILSTMISGAREMNNSIKNSHELELKRAKDLKILQADEGDDVKAIQDIYNAFVSMPTQQNLSGGNQQIVSPLGPMTPQFTTRNDSLFGYAPYGVDPTSIYDNTMGNLSVEQMTMMVEANPSMRHVVTYDPNTGNSSFEIIDDRNGQFVTGIPTKNAEVFMADMQFDFTSMQAHSNNLNESYDIIYVQGGNPVTGDGKDLSKF